MKDLYAEVTQQIIAALEQGVPPWRCPWKDGSAFPSNLVTGKPYRGVNVLILACTAVAKNLADSRWLTFKQANQLGTRIRKGEHGTAIVFYHLRELDDAQGDAQAGRTDATKRVVPMLRSYIVFNASQLANIPERYELQPPALQPSSQPISEAELLLNQSGAIIQHGGNQAFYRPNEDTIQLPPMGWFDQPENYYAIALHELCHWTGHPQRLNRVLGKQHGIEAYAYEELVAEIGSAFLLAHCGLSACVEHASYIESWLDALRREKRLIFTAAGAAQKAADFVLDAKSVAQPAVAEAL